MRITRRLAELEEAGELAFSFEFFCPDSADGIENLRPRIDRLASTEPLFVDVCASGSLEELRTAVFMCKYAKKFAGLPAMIHVPCADLTVDEARTLLDEAKALGISNLLCQRGCACEDEPSTPLSASIATRPGFKPKAGGFEHAAELVAWVREVYGSAFCVGVMGFPIGHGEYATRAEDLVQLRAKQDAGADFIVMQHVNEAQTLLDYVAEVRACGVGLPIIASVMPVQNYESFMQVNRYCGVPVPAALQAGLDSLRHDDNAVREFGNRAVVAMCKELMAQGLHVLHFHTLNLEVVIRNVLQDLALCGPGSAPRRKLPWRPSGDESRAHEDVRPIFWANRPASYLERTAGWTEYPSGRWSEAGRGAAQRPFNSISEVQLLPPTVGSVEDRRAIWGDGPMTPQDVWEVFARYVEGRVPRLPWCETELHPETSTMTRTLARLNRAGFLTINSQPRVNGAPSNDPTFGWGGPGGFVYQKAYIECFTPATHLAALMDAASRHPSISYQAVDVRGNVYSNPKARGVQAVTWGVFPDREVLQPTVVDAEAFMAWKTEAFALWLSLWAPIYDEDSSSHALVHDIHDSYFLVNLVDNDFVAGDIFRVFEDALAKLRNDSAVDFAHAASTRQHASSRAALAQQQPLASSRSGAPWTPSPAHTSMAPWATPSGLLLPPAHAVVGSGTMFSSVPTQMATSWQRPV